MFVQLSALVCTSCLLFALHCDLSACIESMFIFMISREATSGIPISACPLLGTTKNTQHFLMFLNFMNTVHVPNYMILVLIVCVKPDMILYGSLKLVYCDVLKYFLNMWNGIILPSLPVLTLYGFSTLFLPANVSKLAVITDWFLFTCTESILTISICPSWDSCTALMCISCTACSFLLLQTFL